MKQKYEFRGYCEMKDKWVYGYLIADNVIIEKGKAYIVDEDSVSIWTKMYDSKGKKIFTNDIVICDKEIYRVEFSAPEYILVAASGRHIRYITDGNDLRVIATDYIK